MKKLTKLTALALALALVLGMTAFAGTPSEVVMTDNWEDSLLNGVPDLKTLKTNRTAVSFTAADSSTVNYFKLNTQITAGLTAGTKYSANIAYTGSADYYGNNSVLTLEEDGTIVHSAVSAGNRVSIPQLGFTFPEAWTYNEEYALVAQMGYNPLGASNSDIVRSHNASDKGPFGAIVTTTATDADTGETTDSTYLRQYTGIYSAAGSTNLGIYGGNQAHATSYTDISKNKLEFGTKHLITTVIRPHYSHFLNNSVAAPDDSLNLLTLIDRNACGNATYHTYTGNVNDGFTSSYDPVTSVHGLWYAIPSKFNVGLHSFKVYKVSLDRADFTIADASKAQTSILTDDAIEIEFSQPLSNSTDYLGSSDATFYDTLENDIVITDEDGNSLTYGEDYTIALSEKADGTAMKGVMTITPVDDWAYGTTYTVTLPSVIKNIALIEMAAENNVPVTFTTVEAPTFTMTLDAYKGLSATGTALTALEAGTTYFAVSATQSAGVTMTNGNVRIEILDAEGNVVKYATANKALSTTAANTFGAAFKLEAGQTAKAYVVGTKGVATK